MVVTRSQRREQKRKDAEVGVGKVVLLPDRPVNFESEKPWCGLVLQFNPVDKSKVLVMDLKLLMSEYKVSSLIVHPYRDEADEIRSRLIEFGRRYGAKFAQEIDLS